MSEIETSLPFPLDDEGFFRRECPYCCKEFKVLLKKDELSNLAQRGIDSFMLELKEEAKDLDERDYSEDEFICPYCGQHAPNNSWWTQEQLAYINIIAKNIMARIVNENLIRPLKRTFGKPTTSMVSMHFKGKEVEQQEPWISPEVNDMEIFDLPCCQRKVKVEDSWNSEVHCFFCGFPNAKEGQNKCG